MSAAEFSRIRLADPKQLAELRQVVEKAKEKLAAAMSVFNEVVTPEAIDRAIAQVNEAEHEYNDAVRQFREFTGVEVEDCACGGGCSGEGVCGDGKGG